MSVSIIMAVNSAVCWHLCLLDAHRAKTVCLFASIVPTSTNFATVDVKFVSVGWKMWPGDKTFRLPRCLARKSPSQVQNIAPID